jgi:hypothetical protein
MNLHRTLHHPENFVRRSSFLSIALRAIATIASAVEQWVVNRREKGTRDAKECLAHAATHRTGVRRIAVYGVAAPWDSRR